MPFNRIMGSVFNPMNLLQVAMGPAGWATLAMRTIGSQIGMNVIQNIGQQLGLPQSMIDMAQGAFAMNMGMPGLARQEISQAVDGLAREFTFSPRQSADMIRTANQAIGDMAARLAEGEDVRRARSAGGAEAGGWLMALASVMGEKLNEKAEQVQDLASQITDETPDKTAKFGAASQEFGIMMNATNNAIKSLGEGLSTMARKQ